MPDPDPERQVHISPSGHIKMHGKPLPDHVRLPWERRFMLCLIVMTAVSLLGVIVVLIQYWCRCLW